MIVMYKQHCYLHSINHFLFFKLIFEIHFAYFFQVMEGHQIVAAEKFVFEINWHYLFFRFFRKQMVVYLSLLFAHFLFQTEECIIVNIFGIVSVLPFWAFPFVNVLIDQLIRHTCLLFVVETIITLWIQH